MDLGVFQWKKRSDGIYTRELARYRVIATDVPSQHQGRVTVFYRDFLQFMVESQWHFTPSVFSLHLVLGGRRWYIVGCYLTPYDASTINNIVTAIRQSPRRNELLMAGDFNVNLDGPMGNYRNKDNTSALAEAVIEYMSAHFLMCCNSWELDIITLSMVGLCQEVQSRKEYLLVMDQYLFRNISVWDLWHNLDHYMILGCLNISNLRQKPSTSGGICTPPC